MGILVGLSKSITLYLAPMMVLVGFILHVLVFLSPSLIFTGKVALMTVSPPTSANLAQAPDGPSVFFGPLGMFLSFSFDQVNA